MVKKVGMEKKLSPLELLRTRIEPTPFNILLSEMEAIINRLKASNTSFKDIKQNSEYLEKKNAILEYMRDRMNEPPQGVAIDINNI